MGKIVEKLGWKYLSIVYEESNYGIKVNLFILVVSTIMSEILFARFFTVDYVTDHKKKGGGRKGQKLSSE